MSFDIQLHDRHHKKCFVILRRWTHKKTFVANQSDAKQTLPISYGSKNVQRQSEAPPVDLGHMRLRSSVNTSERPGRSPIRFMNVTTLRSRFSISQWCESLSACRLQHTCHCHSHTLHTASMIAAATHRTSQIKQAVPGKHSLQPWQVNEHQVLAIPWRAPEATRGS